MTGRAPVRRERPTASTAGRTTGSRTSTRSTTSRAAVRKEEKPIAICPVHFTQLPANGICDLCE